MTRGRPKGVKNKIVRVKFWMKKVEDGDYTLAQLVKITGKSINVVRSTVFRYGFSRANEKKKPKVWRWDSKLLIEKENKNGKFFRRENCDERTNSENREIDNLSDRNAG